MTAPLREQVPSTHCFELLKATLCINVDRIFGVLPLTPMSEKASHHGCVVFRTILNLCFTVCGACIHISEFIGPTRASCANPNEGFCNALETHLGASLQDTVEVESQKYCLQRLRLEEECSCSIRARFNGGLGG
jgi:hypothetical protein